MTCTDRSKKKHLTWRQVRLKIDLNPIKFINYNNLVGSLLLPINKSPDEEATDFINFRQDFKLKKTKDLGCGSLILNFFLLITLFSFFLRPL